MQNKKQKIINKIFKILPAYEEGVEFYLKYLQRVIIELSGEDMKQFTMLDEIITGLNGLLAQKENITHAEVRRIVFKYISKIDTKKEG